MTATLRQMPESPEWLKTPIVGKPLAVDREKNVVNGVVLAEEGPFKSGRGEFDRKAIRAIVKMGNEKAAGLKSRFTHPTLSDDGLGKHLGRIKNLRSETMLRESDQRDANGKPMLKEVLVARGDLHLDPTALEEPPSGGKPLGKYVMDLAESDPDAFGTSLVLQRDEEYRIDKQGKPLKNDNGDELPPLWLPTKLHASDVVGEGDATNSFLSADVLDSLPDAIVRRGVELLDSQFAGQERNVVQARLSAFIDRYLSHRFGESKEPAEQLSEQVEPPKTEDWVEAELYLIEQEGAK